MKSLRLAIEARIKEILNTHLMVDEWAYLISIPIEAHKIIAETAQTLEDDIIAYTERDPATKGSYKSILHSSNALVAIIHYRTATAFWSIKTNSLSLREVALHISNTGKVKSNIDIHPGATIGKRFVLDHANGTVIGETAVIGDDCYILGNVTLGAYGIADNASQKRHPTIGNNVQIGANARILGPIQVGDNVFISPFSVIVKDIPNNSTVSIINQLQLTREKNYYSDLTPKVQGAFVLNNSILVGCLGVPGVDAYIINKDHCINEDVSCNVIRLRQGLFEITISVQPKFYLVANYLSQQWHLELHINKWIIAVLDPPGLNKLLCSVIQENNNEYIENRDQNVI